MAELDKVIQGLDCCLAVKNAGTKTCFDCPYREKDGYLNTPCEDYLMADALELLKKQTPIEPEYFMDGLVKRCRCKKCGKHIVSVGRYSDNYCAKCGQAVKWE